MTPLEPPIKLPEVVTLIKSVRKTIKGLDDERIYAGRGSNMTGNAATIYSLDLYKLMGNLEKIEKYLEWHI